MIFVDIKAKYFGATEVLKDVSFELQQGRCLAILGKSGIGKTTLLRLVAGIDTDFEGTIRRPDVMAIVFQEPTLLLWRTALENIRIIHPHLSETIAREMLARVGLKDKVDVYPRQLSLGQQRRLSLARAFAGRPQLLILDEPFASLDTTTANEMIALTKTLVDEVAPATLFVTHDKDETRLLADEILELV
ncbi:MAG: ATP-binding cassette domain-containing protein [Roseibium sp.]